MQRVMQSDAAVFRTGETLNDGKRKLAQVFASFADVKVSDRSLIWNTDLIETLELDNLLRPGGRHHAFGGKSQGKPRRAGARGFPQSRRPELAEAHAVLGRFRRGQRRFDYRPVHLNTLTDEVESIPPEGADLLRSIDG